jgi:hypothetical protein
VALLSGAPPIQCRLPLASVALDSKKTKIKFAAQRNKIQDLQERKKELYEIKHHIGTSFCPPSLEETMRTGGQ